MNDLVSIVLPVYNGAEFLKESIDSVLAQTHQNWELLILDDCSTDETPSIAMEYQALDSRVTYYRNEKNLKLPGNLNRGFSLAKGDYLTWTSDDNRFRPRALEMMLATLKGNPQAQLVYASYQIMDKMGDKHQIFYADSNKDHILGSNIVGACFMYTRKVYETVGEYDTELFLVEDFDYWQRVLMQFEAVAISDVLYDYRWHENSLTSTKKQVAFGERQEKMLLKNRDGFGKLSAEGSFYYYQALYRSREYQERENPYVLNYWCARCIRRVSQLVNRGK